MAIHARVMSASLNTCAVDLSQHGSFSDISDGSFVI